MSTTLRTPADASSVGRLLQHWRKTRRKSQLSLALSAGVSARHVGFVEIGRANPSREMVMLLAGVLDVPLRDRNTLLLAAGYAPVYRETGLEAPEMAQVKKAVDLILGHQEPYPAVVMDRYWNIVRTNGAGERFFAHLLSGAPPVAEPNVVRLMFDPAGLRPHVANWEAVAEALVQRVHREALGGTPDERTQALLDEVLSYPGVPQHFRRPDLLAAFPAPFLSIQFRRGTLAMDYFSTVTTLGTPLDVTLQETRIECFFPGNVETERATRAAAGS
jgi:transcriptional regulator with XRE-family HTH domain